MVLSKTCKKKSHDDKQKKKSRSKTKPSKKIGKTSNNVKKSYSKSKHCCDELKEPLTKYAFSDSDDDSDELLTDNSNSKKINTNSNDSFSNYAFDDSDDESTELLPDNDCSKKKYNSDDSFSNYAFNDSDDDSESVTDLESSEEIPEFNIKNCKKVLKQVFGHDQFRGHQYKIIKNIIEKKRDVCAIMFTGAGKSICYQFPPVFLNKMALIVSPLIALMTDQQLKLSDINVPSICLNSTVKSKVIIKKNILANKYRIIYVTPEYLIKNQGFVTKIGATGNLVLIAIDESHCVSSWGHDFRAAYRELSCIKKLTDAPVMAVTATATEKVRSDIINMLKLKNPLNIKTTFDRPNLYIQVKLRTCPQYDILPILKDKSPSIIYCQKRNMTEKISDKLLAYGIKSAPYHAGMSDEYREQIHVDFINNDLDCVVATNAYGMGIDKTIRNVIHYGISSDIESYYQEIGRAGRDGMRGNCYVFYDPSDIATNNYFVNNIDDQKYKKHKKHLLTIINKYLYSNSCRRKYILNYFGETYKLDNCGMCDNCTNTDDLITKDFTKEAQQLLNLIDKLECGYGSTRIVEILRGSKNKNITYNMKKTKQYGKGKDHNVEWWKIFIRIMITNAYLSEESIGFKHGTILNKTRLGTKLLKNIKMGTKLELVIPEEMKKYYK